MENYGVLSAESGYQVYKLYPERKELIKTFNHQDFPPLPEAIANLLASDLNRLDAAHQLPNSLNRSLVYCTLSTLSDAGDAYEFALDVPQCIQWDKIYRLAPGPPYRLLQYNALTPVLNFFSDKWEDLPLNYCQSIEEMQEEEVPFVSQKIIDVLQGFLNGFHPAQQFAVELLFHYFDRTSISLPILWVAGIIDTKDWVIINLYFDDLKAGHNLSNRDQELIKHHDAKLYPVWELITLVKQEGAKLFNASSEMS
jgi:hypothetical protein